MATGYTRPAKRANRATSETIRRTPTLWGYGALTVDTCLAFALGAASVLAALGVRDTVRSRASDAPPGHSLGSLSPAPPEGEVVAQGTVMDVGGHVELCLGAVADSYPPQCSGIPVANWSWDGTRGLRDVGRHDVGRLRRAGDVRRRQLHRDAAADHARALRPDAAARSDRTGRRVPADEATLHSDPGRAARHPGRRVSSRRPRTAGSSWTSSGMTARGSMPPTPTTGRTSC